MTTLISPIYSGGRIMGSDVFGDPGYKIIFAIGVQIEAGAEHSHFWALCSAPL